MGGGQEGSKPRGRAKQGVGCTGGTHRGPVHRGAFASAGGREQRVCAGGTWGEGGPGPTRGERGGPGEAVSGRGAAGAKGRQPGSMRAPRGHGGGGRARRAIEGRSAAERGEKPSGGMGGLAGHPGRVRAKGSRGSRGPRGRGGGDTRPPPSQGHGPPGSFPCPADREPEGARPSCPGRGPAGPGDSGT